MKKGAEYSSVTVGTLIIKGDWVFNPTGLTVAVSDDGKNFADIAHIDFPVFTQEDPDGIHDFTIDFPKTSSPYLKVTAHTLTQLPDWHSGAGNPGFIFVDEIIVK